MSYNAHFTKKHFQLCDREGEYLQGVFNANRGVHILVIDEFRRFLKEEGISEVEAVKRIKLMGGLTSRNTINKLAKGDYYVCSTTFLNILSRFCGYTDCLELGHVVKSRLSGKD